MNTWMIRLLVCAVGLLCLSQANAQQTELDGTPIDSSIYRSYESNWRKYARFACKVGDGYGYFPNYDRRFDSSLNMNATDYMRETAVTVEQRTGNLVRKRQVTVPREDAEAWVTALPDTNIGSYGWIKSAEIVRVLDRNRMLVKKLWLVDQEKLHKQYEQDKKNMIRRDGEANLQQLNFDYANRIKLKRMQEMRTHGFEDTFLLIGYDARGLRPGDRWQGPDNKGFKVGVVRWQELGEDDQEKGNKFNTVKIKQLPVLSEIDEPMRNTLDSEGFKKLLGERGMTVASFVDLVRSIRSTDSANADERIQNTLMPPPPEED